jgi:hypothetical protein
MQKQKREQLRANNYGSAPQAIFESNVGLSKKSRNKENIPRLHSGIGGDLPQRSPSLSALEAGLVCRSEATPSAVMRHRKQVGSRRLDVLRAFTNCGKPWSGKSYLV